MCCSEGEKAWHLQYIYLAQMRECFSNGALCHRDYIQLGLAPTFCARVWSIQHQKLDICCLFFTVVRFCKFLQFCHSLSIFVYCYPLLFIILSRGLALHFVPGSCQSNLWSWKRRWTLHSHHSKEEPQCIDQCEKLRLWNDHNRDYEVDHQ